MEARELRIGNFVDWNGEVGIVSQLLEKDVFFKCGETDLYDALKPIPLTEEWLFRFGYFKLDDYKTTIHFVVKGHLIWLCNDLFMCEKNGVILKYVHQLQNLYFALQQKELTIINQE